MAVLSGRARFHKVEGVVTRQICDETLLVPVVRGIGELDHIYSLNSTAGLVWDLLEPQRTLGEIAAQVTARFQIDQATAQADLFALVEQYESLKFIQRVDDPAARVQA